MIPLDKKLAKNFKLKEFLRNRWFDKEDERTADKLYFDSSEIRHNILVLAIQLQNVRNYATKKHNKTVRININIALRPIEYELKQGRSGTSTHTKGLAADVTTSDITIREMHNCFLECIKKGIILDGGLGLYKTFIHYDFSMENKARRW
jgi:uncharacterized protein YcbK (DUF882 family)